MRLRPKAGPTALDRALGPAAFELVIGSDAYAITLSMDEYTAVTLRRAHGLREPLGEPASMSCSVRVLDVAQVPDRGAAVRLQLTAAALDQLFGTDPAQATARARAQVRFTGRVTDATLSTRPSGAVMHLIATGTTARLGDLTLGAAPWPVETVGARAARLESLIEGLDPGVVLTRAADLGRVPIDESGTLRDLIVPARDVDRKPAQQVLVELAEASGEYALTELRDGSLLWSHALTELPAVELPAALIPSDVDFERVEHVNDVFLTYGPADGPQVGDVIATNLIKNPSVETDTTGWLGAVNGTFSRDTTTAAVGAASVKNVVTTGGVQARLPGELVTLEPGKRYGVRVSVRSSVAKELVLYAEPISNGSWDNTRRIIGKLTPAANTWAGIYGVYTVDLAAIAPQARFGVLIESPTAGQSFWADALLCVETGSDDFDGQYFDGSSPTGRTDYTVAWTGTAHASTSRKIAAADATRPELRATDPYRLSTFPPPALTQARLDVELDLSTDREALRRRAEQEWRTGGWRPGALPCDVLALLNSPPTSEGSTPAGPVLPSVVETVAADFSGVTQATVTLATAPQPGDVILLAATFAGVAASSGGGLSAAGCGAAWAQRYYCTSPQNGVGVNNFTHGLLWGTAPSAAGVVTLTWTGGAAKTGHVRAYLVRGLTGSTVAAVTKGANAATSLIGPSDTPQLGQLVVDLVSTLSKAAGGTSWPTGGTSPAPAQWTRPAVFVNAVFGTFGTARHIPDVAGVEHHTESTSSTAVVHWITQLVIGDPAPPPPPPAPDAPGALVPDPVGTARQLLQAELGSKRTITGAGELPHRPALDGVEAYVTVLNETITPHRWVITTESEQL